MDIQSTNGGAVIKGRNGNGSGAQIRHNQMTEATLAKLSKNMIRQTAILDQQCKTGERIERRLDQMANQINNQSRGT